MDSVSNNEARVPWLILDGAQMFQCVCISSFCVFNAELFHTSRKELLMAKMVIPVFFIDFCLKSFF